jgi:hypothetical protein
MSLTNTKDVQLKGMFIVGYLGTGYLIAEVLSGLTHGGLPRTDRLRIVFECPILLLGVL